MGRRSTNCPGGTGNVRETDFGKRIVRQHRCPKPLPLTVVRSCPSLSSKAAALTFVQSYRTHVHHGCQVVLHLVFMLLCCCVNRVVATFHHKGTIPKFPKFHEAERGKSEQLMITSLGTYHFLLQM
jgi:hypothetical protein